MGWDGTTGWDGGWKACRVHRLSSLGRLRFQCFPSLATSAKELVVVPCHSQSPVSYGSTVAPAFGSVLG